MLSIETLRLQLETPGHTSIHDITEAVQLLITEAGMSEGQAGVYGIGSTTGISTLEYEPGLVNKDVGEMLQQLAPYGKPYLHNQTWGDDNGASHLRSFLAGTSFTVPFSRGKLLLGTWQQIVFLDFDTRARRREVVVQLIGK